MPQKSRTGGIIAAARKRTLNGQPVFLQPVGSITAIRRIVSSFMKAGVRPIVIVTGYDSDILEDELAMYPVFFLKLEEDDRRDLFGALCVGIRYLQGKCSRILFTPVETPLFSPETIQRLLMSDACAAVPVYEEQGGHPLMLSGNIFPDILRYEGEDGIPGLFSELGVEREWIEVDDPGILFHLRSGEPEPSFVSAHNTQLFRPILRVRLGKESIFMGGRLQYLLTMINETHSLRDACGYVRVSYSQAWKMINKLEEGLGYPVVLRKHGGKHGGKTQLTEEGIEFLKKYNEYESSVRSFAMTEFDRIFTDSRTSES